MVLWEQATSGATSPTMVLGEFVSLGAAPAEAGSPSSMTDQVVLQNPAAVVTPQQSRVHTIR